MAAPITPIANFAMTFDGPFGSNLKSADYVPAGVRVVRLENIGHLRFNSDKETFISAQKYERLTRHALVAGDILFSSFVDSQVRVCQFPDGLGPAINKADCFVIRVNTGECNTRYMTYMLASPQAYEIMKAMVHGATRPRIGLSQLREFGVPLPKLPEQKCIADKLDLLTSRLARKRAELKRAYGLLAKQRETVIATCLERTTHGLPRVRFVEKIALLTSGSRDWAKFYDRGSSVFVLAGNVRMLRFDPTPKRFVDPPPDSPDARRSRIEKDDLLITIVGAGTGDICHVPAEYEGYFVCQSVARIKLVDQCLSEFYTYWFVSTEHGGAEFREAMYGAARPHLSFEQLKAFMVPDLTVEAAQDTVRDIQKVLAHTDRIEAELDRVRALLDRLESAILGKAFRGELMT